MSLRFYLRQSADAATGLTGEQSSDTADLAQFNGQPDAGSLKAMLDGAVPPSNPGLYFTNSVLLAGAAASRKTVFQKWWVAPAFAGPTTITVGTIDFYFGWIQQAGAGNPRIRPYVYVWRPGTGIVGTLYGSGGAGITDAGNAPTGSWTAYKQTFAATGGSFIAGDRIVLELWVEETNGGGHTLLVAHEGSGIAYTHGASLGGSPDIASWIEISGLGIVQDGSGTITGTGTTSASGGVIYGASGDIAGSGVVDAASAGMDAAASGDIAGAGTTTGDALVELGTVGSTSGSGTTSGNADIFAGPVSGTYLMRGIRTTAPFDYIYWRTTAPDPLAVLAPLPLVMMTDIVIAWRSKIPSEGGTGGGGPPPPEPPSFPLMYPQPGPNLGELI